MKIRAEFYTPDECDAAAGAVRRMVPQVLDIAVKSNTARNNYADEDYGTVYAVYSGLYDINRPTSPVCSIDPVFGRNDMRYMPRGRYSAEFVCREADARDVSHIVVNCGGHNIRCI